MSADLAAVVARLEEELAAVRGRLDRHDGDLGAQRGRLDGLAADVAELQSALVAPEPDRRHCGITWRRWALKRIHRRFFGGCSPRAAARLIHLAWSAVATEKRNEYRPGTLEARLAELHVQMGGQVLGETQIALDLRA